MTTQDDEYSSSSYPRLLVIFRPPSRHTYGFQDGDIYDLPLLELQTLIHRTDCCQDGSIQYIPAAERKNGDKNNQTVFQQWQSRNQLKKKRLNKKKDSQDLYWIIVNNNCSNNNDDVHGIISNAASRAILTHALFEVTYSASFTNDDWIENIDEDKGKIALFLEKFDVVNMSNTNMSNEERSSLIGRISVLLQQNDHDAMQHLPHQMESGKDNAIIYHSSSSSSSQQSDISHFIHIGTRMAIGPAGTRGAPSQTLRRTHRGILKEYALKRRVATTTNGATSNISTSMEPEVGFLMNNLALTGSDGQRVLDPCCGSGSLLLYAAALGATNLVGVDSDISVFESAKDEFNRHKRVLTGEKSGSVISRLAIPRFIHGDVLDPSSTECLCTPNSFDSIVCDPPYNIGAPVLIGGEDARPINYHHNDSKEKGRDGATSVQIDAIIPSILTIACNVLVDGGRLVFFLPVRGEEMSMSLEHVLSKKGWQVSGTNDEQLQIQFGRLQHFSPTFARWLICMTKCV